MAPAPESEPAALVSGRPALSDDDGSCYVPVAYPRRAGLVKGVSLSPQSRVVCGPQRTAIREAPNRCPGHGGDPRDVSALCRLAAPLAIQLPKVLHKLPGQSNLSLRQAGIAMLPEALIVFPAQVQLECRLPTDDAIR